jgi:hypothetical protein
VRGGEEQVAGEVWLPTTLEPERRNRSTGGHIPNLAKINCGPSRGAGLATYGNFFSQGQGALLCKFDAMPFMVWLTTPQGLGSGVDEKATMSPLSPVVALTPEIGLPTARS